MTVSDLRLMNARQIAAFAAFEESETQTVENEIEFEKTDSGRYNVIRNGEFVGVIFNQNSYGNSNPKGYELCKYKNGAAYNVMVGTLPACKKAAKSL